MLNPPYELAEFDPGRTDELVAMWRASFERGVGIVDPHPLAEQRAYLLEVVVPDNTLRVALDLDQAIVGFVAATQDSIAQLYVHVDHQGRGIGTGMLDWAKAQSSGALWLYTFERNLGAQRFYEKHGFVAAARGFEKEWRLEDIRYEWRR